MKLLEKIMNRGHPDKLQKRESALQDFLTSPAGYACPPYGYVSLAEIPEIQTAINRIGELLGIMTIHLKENTEQGDRRVVNGLSRILDITPTRYQTRQIWIQKLTRALLLNGNAFALPKYTKDGLLSELELVDPRRVRRLEPSPYTGDGYAVEIGGKVFDPMDILHFVLSPDPEHVNWGRGYAVELNDVKQNLKQTSRTRREFMETRVLPSLIISMNTASDVLNSEASRREIYKKYFDARSQGVPWIVPEELFKFEQIKPLTLNDIAITETMTLDKRTVASVFGLPSFLLGEGAFNREEFNTFVKSRLLVFAQIIEQELTKKLIYSPSMFFKFNPWGLYSYGLETLAQIGGELKARGICTGNEVRDWVGLPPAEGLDEFTTLENYIPIQKLGDQKKLLQESEVGEQ